MTLIAVLGRAEQGLTNNVLGHIASYVGGISELAVVEDHPEVETWAAGRGIPCGREPSREPDCYLALPGLVTTDNGPVPAESILRELGAGIVVRVISCHCSPPTYDLEVLSC